MIEPYRMVFTSMISSIIGASILIIYFKFFARKKINYLLILLVISIPPIISIFRPGTYESGDLSLHTMRTMSFYNILFNEHLLPRWTPEFNMGYGDPHFIFTYFLPYFIGSVFHFIGFSFLSSIKLLLAFSFILSGLTMYLWSKDELGEKAGLVAAIFYLFAPYHLVDLHFRVTIAETLSFVFLPLLLLLTKKIITQPTALTIISTATCYALLVLTHQVATLTFSPILASYAIFVWFSKKKREYKDLFAYATAIFLALLLSAFYWLPIIFEARYTHESLMTIDQLQFIQLQNLLYSPWRFGFLFQGNMGQLSLILGYTQILIIFLSIYMLVKKKFDSRTKPLLLFFLTLFFIFAFFVLPQSREVWKMIPLHNYVQFSYRLLEPIALFTAIIAGIVITKWKNKFIIALCILTIFYTILNWGNRRAIPEINSESLIIEFSRKPDVSMGGLEPTSPIWADLEKSKLRTKPLNHVEIVSGSGKIKELSRNSIEHKYIISAESKIKIKENTLYFPGWTLLINGKPHKIAYTEKDSPGVIFFSLNRGLYEAQLVFQNTKERTFSLFVSIITSILIVLTLSFSILKKHIAISLLSNNTNVSRTKRKRKLT